jgi:hypothetical protein
MESRALHGKTIAEWSREFQFFAVPGKRKPSPRFAEGRRRRFDFQGRFQYESELMISFSFRVERAQ